ncbi:MAG: hypothetical protein BWY15_01385 [Firmicutes bacterium ADurb.Bin193]|nr:MAG: hypothetical protein BWY15_01385 [Firmicutes bacterium ADurb.Bin193]
MSVIEKARELGLMLAQSKEFIRMRTAEQAQQQDEEATKLIEEYTVSREALLRRAHSDDITPDQLHSIRSELEAGYEKLKKNAKVAEYIESAAEFNNLMQEVNTAISFYIYPQDEGCGGDCGDCGGCH